MSEGESDKIPWWGTRKFARAVVAERDKIASELTTEKAKAVRLDEIAQNLMNDAKQIQAENDRLKSQMRDLSLLPIVELETKRLELENEINSLNKQSLSKELRSRLTEPRCNSK